VFINNSARTLSEKGMQVVKGSLIPKNAVMMSCIATVGRCGITMQESVTNQQINSVVCGADVDPRYLYWSFRSLGKDLKQIGGGGSVYTNVSKSRFSSIEVIIPPIRIQKAFSKLWFDKLKANGKESLILTRLRDILLPKLLSGKLSITDAEKQLEEAA
jgi:type I restriction enzyme S subunit